MVVRSALLVGLATATVACGARSDPPPVRQTAAARPSATVASAAPTSAEHTYGPSHAPDPAYEQRRQARAADLVARSAGDLSCEALQAAYRESFDLATACAMAADCTALAQTSLICPGCEALLNPATAAYADVRQLAAAFTQKGCSLAPCTPPLCEHRSATCQRGVCVTAQR